MTRKSNPAPPSIRSLQDRARSLLAESASAGSEEDSALRELLHDLHMLHAEMEIQNEELRQALDRLETERDRYADLFDSAPVGYCLLDENGVAREVNLTAASMLGADRRRMIGFLFSRRVAPDSRSRFYSHLQTARAEAGPVFVELELIREDGDPMPARLESTALMAENAGMIRMAMTDISRRRTAEADHRLASAHGDLLRDENIALMERFRLLADRAGMAIFICDEKHFRFVNAACERIAGRSRETLLRLSPADTLRPDCRRDMEERLRAILDYPSRPVTCRLDVLTPENIHRPVEVTLSAIIDGATPAFLGTAVENPGAGDDPGGDDPGGDDPGGDDPGGDDPGGDDPGGDDPGGVGSASASAVKIRAERLTREVADLHTTLSVLERKRQEDRREIEENLMASLRQTVYPEMAALKRGGAPPDVRKCLTLLERALEQMTASFSRSLATGPRPLTPTESRVAWLIKEGLTSQEIADHLNISTKTVSYHRGNLRRKLGLKSREESLRDRLSSLS